MPVQCPSRHLPAMRMESPPEFRRICGGVSTTKAVTVLPLGLRVHHVSAAAKEGLPICRLRHGISHRVVGRRQVDRQRVP